MQSLIDWIVPFLCIVGLLYAWVIYEDCKMRRENNAYWKQIEDELEKTYHVPHN